MDRTSLQTFTDIILNTNFRWIVLGITIILTIIAYIQEPIRFSKKKSPFGIGYKTHYFVLICITLFIYVFNVLTLEFTVPFSKNMPYLWYVPLIIIAYSIILDITSNSKTVDDKEGDFNPPPKYMLPRKYRLLILYFILGLDIITFIQGMLYAGVNIQFKTTLLHQFFLNRFGGFKPGNMLIFIISWLGIVGLLIDAYVINNHAKFNACEFGLPESWNF